MRISDDAVQREEIGAGNDGRVFSFDDVAVQGAVDHQAAIEWVFENLFQLLGIDAHAAFAEAVDDTGVFQLFLKFPFEGLFEETSGFVDEDFALAIDDAGGVAEGRLGGPFAFEEGFADAIHHAFAAEGVFVLGKAEIDVLLEFATWGKGFGGLGDGFHGDAAFFEFAGDVNGVCARAGETVEVVDDDDVDFFAGLLREVNHTLEFLSFIGLGGFVGATEKANDFVVISHDVVEAAFLLGFEAVVIFGLFLGGDAGVDDAVSGFNFSLNAIEFCELLEAVEFVFHEIWEMR
ncbi:MAG: hypothetical protein AAF570_11395 [Bacteroidota bacterium]